MGLQKLILGSRQSPLARAQVEEALSLLRSLPSPPEMDCLWMETPGDRDLSVPLDDPSIPEDIFTRDLDQALLDGRIDLAIHSAKDLPQTLHPNLRMLRLAAREIRDALVVRPGFEPHPEKNMVVGTSSPHRAEQIQRIYPDCTLKPIRGNIQQRIAQVDKGEYDAVIMAACALERLQLSSRIHSYLPYSPAPHQGRLALTWRASDHDLETWLRPLDIREQSGLVALVGCPADPEYLNRKAERYLDHADVVIHDRLIPDEILLRIQGKAIPVGKTGKAKSMAQDEINRLMLREAEQGKLVLRLHGGDPCIYGHLSEELEFLRDWEIRYDIVTSVTAAQVASAHAGAPLTHRGDTGDITFIPGYKAAGEPMHFPGPERGNLAVYMGVSSIADVRGGLLASGWPETTPVLVGERLGYRNERTRACSLLNVDQLDIQRPAVFLVGTRSFPPEGWTLFTGTDPSSFLAHGPLLHWPLIQLAGLPLEPRVAALRTGLDAADGIIFPSRFAVDLFMETLLGLGDSRLLAGKTLLSVGPTTTRRLRELGLHADASVNHYGGVQTLAAQAGTSYAGKYLYPCSDLSPTDQRQTALADTGIELIPLPTYQNHRIPYEMYPGLPIRRVLFTSGSTVDAYFDLYPNEINAERVWLAVGPSTRKALESRGLQARTLIHRGNTHPREYAAHNRGASVNADLN